MKNKIKVLAVLLLPLLSISQAEANTFSSVYVFGDSLSDSGASPSSVLSIYNLIGGDCDPSHPCPTYYEGRFSNGQTAVEYLADAILPGGSSSSNFFNFAVAGATSGIGNYGDGGSQSSSYLLPGMAQQIGLYLSSFSGGVSNDALHVVWGGANDFLTQDSPQLAAKNIAGYVNVLARRGADYILVPNIPNLGMTPFVQLQGADAISAAEGFSVGFNSELALQLSGMAALFPATHIAQFDTFGFFNNIAQDPAAYGFTNITDACVSLLSVCTDPAAHVFWDDFHPTTQIHALVAAGFVSQVPLPGTMLFFLSGIMTVFSQGFRRRA
ncbi:hypothetical protein A1359_12390 [Methylomonas lenta]|uniref:GDSL family lipase n=1 Tax=Methylomonas lenta TaxID=980561 RepID=A0A177N5X4_9GAMM|nr:SGNH/GDSL hydrolase family protein [Methylomonas lenta]OAI13428.1 hypothetical protein A1359_12390 [Methylomonas lenta]